MQQASLASPLAPWQEAQFCLSSHPTSLSAFSRSSKADSETERPRSSGQLGIPRHNFANRRLSSSLDQGECVLREERLCCRRRSPGRLKWKDARPWIIALVVVAWLSFAAVLPLAISLNGPGKSN